jgi:hypothetical protein
MHAANIVKTVHPVLLSASRCDGADPCADHGIPCDQIGQLLLAPSVRSIRTLRKYEISGLVVLVISPDFDVIRDLQSKLARTAARGSMMTRLR